MSTLHRNLLSLAFDEFAHEYDVWNIYKNFKRIINKINNFTKSSKSKQKIKSGKKKILSQNIKTQRHLWMTKQQIIMIDNAFESIYNFQR